MNNPLQNQFTDLNYGQHPTSWCDLDVLLLKQHWGELAITKQGAQILHFQPKGQSPWLWLSSKLKPAGQAIRGGIPLCWPWFGAHPSDPDAVPHGPARLAQWNIDVCTNTADSLTMELTPSETLSASLRPRLIIRASAEELEVELHTTNISPNKAMLSQAIHSYFLVSDLEKISIEGVGTCESFNKLTNKFEPAASNSAATTLINKATDATFHHKGSVLLNDSGAQTSMQLEKHQSSSTVIWNPGDTNLPADIPKEEQTKFICIEAANTESFDPVSLEPGEKCYLAVCYRRL